jgi:hypothetical protein
VYIVAPQSKIVAVAAVMVCKTGSFSTLGSQEVPAERFDSGSPG